MASITIWIAKCNWVFYEFDAQGTQSTGFVNIYVDNIILHSRDLDQHLDYLDQEITHPEEANL